MVEEKDGEITGLPPDTSEIHQDMEQLLQSKFEVTAADPRPPGE